MLRTLLARLQQGHRTMRYPAAAPPPLPARFRGRPLVDASRCKAGCQACADACPTTAIQIGDAAAGDHVLIDLGRCLFCTDCSDACPEGAISYSGDHRLATSRREDLLVAAGEEIHLASALDERLRRLFGRSLKLRQVSAGGCNACEADVNVLGTVGWDLGRFGIQIVASPRHADGILVTGCVTENMALALQKTYDAVPPPKIVIAVGACAISGGPFLQNPQQLGGVSGVQLPVDLFVAGCPPHPLTMLDGLLRLLGRLEQHGRVG
ncbi:MAG TPA: 4Fe-4S dicluster domain-containing protein [Planctomycetota bacterium]|nr:4Fe-4S dicluster domain-containing protein [Planctomycetota bacterium]